MIKFFSTIRKKLASENKVAPYLRYAIGEIILVMIGILLALQVNNWNTQRLNKIEETSILFQLREEYKGKLEELNQKVAIRNVMIDGSGKILENIYNENYDLPIDSLNIYLGQSYLTPTYDASNAVTEELLNSGKLYLISNKNLRKLVSEWNGQLDKLIEEEQFLVNSYLSSIDSYMSKTYPIGNLVNPFLDTSSDFSQNFSKSKVDNDYKKIKSRKTVDIKFLFNELEFENSLRTIHDYSIVGNMQSEDVRLYIEEVLELINSEIESKE